MNDENEGSRNEEVVDEEDQMDKETETKNEVPVTEEVQKTIDEETQESSLGNQDGDKDVLNNQPYVLRQTTKKENVVEDVEYIITTNPEYNTINSMNNYLHVHEDVDTHVFVSLVNLVITNSEKKNFAKKNKWKTDKKKANPKPKKIPTKGSPFQLGLRRQLRRKISQEIRKRVWQLLKLLFLRRKKETPKRKVPLIVEIV